MILSSFALPGLVLLLIGGSSLSELFFLTLGGRSFILETDVAGVGYIVAIVLF